MRIIFGATGAVLATLFLAALAYPLVIVAGQSTLMPGNEIGFTTYSKVIGSSYYVSALKETALLCLGTSLLATVWALPLAWRMGRGKAGAVTLRAVSQINFAFAGILYGMLMIILMGNVGVLAIAEAKLLGTENSRGLAFTSFGLALTYLSFQIPRAALILATAVEKIDPTLLAAARTLGARGPAVAWFVIIPLLRPALIEAAGFAFILAMGSFGPALLIARTITIYPAVIYREFTGFLNFEVASAMALLLAGLVLGCHFMLSRLVARYAARTGAGWRERMETRS